MANGNGEVDVKALGSTAFELNLIDVHHFSTNPNRGLPLYWTRSLVAALRLYRVVEYLGSPKLGRRRLPD
jgi:hypothetical protein